MICHRLPPTATLIPLLVLAGLGTAVLAQDSEAPVRAPRAANYDDGSSLEIGGIDVDVVGKTSSAARLAGWRIAQRKGWEMLARRYGRGGSLSDGTLDSVVSAIVVENEQIGGNRYIARLGVEFNRARAGDLLGISIGQARSTPMLVIPIIWSGGVGRAFETKTPWLEAWSRFRAGNSTIDYVRPAGTGPDALLMNTGQVLRPGRGWWRAILTQYGAANVLIPIVHLYRQWPGGPIVATFQARYGPDNLLLGKFAIRVANADALPALLDAGVQRIDAMYQRALAADLFQPDPGLAYRPPAAAVAEDVGDNSLIVDDTTEVAGANTITVQVDTPNAGAVTTAEASIRDVPGASQVVTSSLALGAISVMKVTYQGDASSLAAALEARGWRVQRGNGVIRIERPSGPPTPLPDAKTGTKTEG
ncbi:heavy-metal-associated domain-containing protein [Sphingomonas sp. GlSt437]|uniref:heavy-metal-associated domain-containing protein n=1 Tax=Sphingomonas sp. GlSt437 TaxID=3389970 RepID=UPI003A8849BD